MKKGRKWKRIKTIIVYLYSVLRRKNMRISRIHMSYIDKTDSRVKAITTITFENYLIVRDVKVIYYELHDEYIVVMAQKKSSSGEFHDIFHSITVKMREYISKMVLELYHSGKTEYIDSFIPQKPNMQVSKLKILNKERLLGVASVSFDDVFVIHDIKIIDVSNNEKWFALPSRKVEATGQFKDIVQFLNTKDKEDFDKLVNDAYMKEVYAQEGSNTNSIKNEDTSGWDAITNEAKRIYPTQESPKHYGTYIKYKFGGKDPLDGISIYDGGDYWHFVTYGLSKLYEKETDNKEISGYGMEFTFKLKKYNYKNEEAEIRCICGILQDLARDTFTHGEIFNEFEYIYTGQTKGIDVEQKSKITGFITILDNKFSTINTKNGKVKFVEFIGVTDAELKAIMDKEINVKELYERLGSDVTDYHRNSILDNAEDNLRLYFQEIDGYPTFKFYFPNDLGDYNKINKNVFELVNNNVQKIRVMISKCKSVDSLEEEARKWIEKNKLETKMEEVSYRKEKIRDIPIEVYELRYIEHPNWAHKIYKTAFVNNCKITISGWLLNDREQIINNAFEKLEW